MNSRNAWILKLEVTSLLIGLSVPMLQWCFGGKTTVAGFFADWFFAFVYGNAVGWPMWIVTPRVYCSTQRSHPLVKWPIRMAGVLAASAVGCLIGGLVPLLMYGSNYNYWINFEYAFRLALIISAVMTTFFHASETLKDRLRVSQLQLKQREVERERALQMATAAQLASLESRLHPHFLFNALNSATSLIHEDPDRAETLLTQMAALLRFSLDSAHSGLVPLAHELKIVRDYLEIERARFETRLRYEIDVPDGAMAARVPPLAVQTLVENSVKYAVNSRASGASLRITARIDRETLLLQVVDDGPGFSVASLPQGHGLSNLQERLRTLFGDAETLQISSTSDGTRVSLHIPFAPANESAA